MEVMGNEALLYFPGQRDDVIPWILPPSSLPPGFSLAKSVACESGKQS